MLSSKYTVNPWNLITVYHSISQMARQKANSLLLNNLEGLKDCYYNVMLFFFRIIIIVKHVFIKVW